MTKREEWEKIRNENIIVIARRKNERINWCKYLMIDGEAVCIQGFEQPAHWQRQRERMWAIEKLEICSYQPWFRNDKAIINLGVEFRYSTNKLKEYCVWINVFFQFMFREKLYTKLKHQHEELMKSNDIGFFHVGIWNQFKKTSNSLVTFRKFWIFWITNTNNTLLYKIRILDSMNPSSKG